MHMRWFLSLKSEFSIFRWISNWLLIGGEIWSSILIKNYRDRTKTWLHVFLGLPNFSELLQCEQHVWFTRNDFNQHSCPISLGLVYIFLKICKKTWLSAWRLSLCPVYLYTYRTESGYRKPVSLREKNTNWLLNPTHNLSMFRFIT